MAGSVTLSPTAVAGRLRWRLFALLLILLVALGGATAYLARGWATDDLAEALGGKAQQVLTEADRVLTNAWALGIPFDHEDVVHQGFDYFRRLLLDNPEIRFLAVADLDRTLFFYEGTNRERLSDLMTSPDLAAFTTVEGLARGGTGDRAVAVGDFSIRVAALLEDEQPVAALYVGIDRRIADRYFGPRLWVLGAAFVALAALGWLGICFAVDRFWTEPASRLAARLSAARRNRWTIVNSRREGGEFRGVARALNLVAADLRDRHDHAIGLSEEIRTQALDPSVAEAAAQCRSRFDGDLPIAFATGEGDAAPLRPTAAQRLVATGCLALAGTLLVPVLPTGSGVAITAGIGLLAGGVASRFGNPMILAALATVLTALGALAFGALPMAAYLLALAGGIAVGLPLAGGVSAVGRDGLSPAGWTGQTVAATVAGLAGGILIVGLAEVASLPLAPTLGWSAGLLLGPAAILLLVAVVGRPEAEDNGREGAETDTPTADPPADPDGTAPTEVRDAA